MVLPTSVSPLSRERRSGPLKPKSWGYLIVTKAGTVWLAREYSVKGSILEFVTSADAQKSVPLTEVDRLATELLNRERGVAVYIR
jgi:hypothetical protein